MSTIPKKAGIQWQRISVPLMYQMTASNSVATQLPQTMAQLACLDGVQQGRLHAILQRAPLRAPQAKIRQLTPRPGSTLACLALLLGKRCKPSRSLCDDRHRQQGVEEAGSDTVLPPDPTSSNSQLTPRSTSTLGCLVLPRGGVAELGLPSSCLLSLLRISAGDSTG